MECRWRVGLAALLAAAMVGAEEAEEKIYRWVGEDGAVVFSSRPPPPGVEATEMKVPEAQSISSPPPAQLPAAVSDPIGQQVDQRMNERQALQQSLVEAQERLTQARQALQEGKTPLAGERQRTVSGGNRLMPAYFERQEELRQAVEKAAAAVDQLQKELRDMPR